MTKQHKPDEFYNELAKKLNEAVPQPKRGFTVREAGAILGYGENTFATLNCLRNMVRLGLVYEEQNGKYRKYYLP